MGSGLSGVAGIRVGRLVSWNLEDRVWSLKVSGVQDHGFKVGCEFSECTCRAPKPLQKRDQNSPSTQKFVALYYVSKSPDRKHLILGFRGLRPAPLRV